MKAFLNGMALLVVLADATTAQDRQRGTASDAGGPQADTYRSAAIDADGSLRITTSDRRVIVVPKAGEQTAFERPVISEDRTAVGAQAMFKNCCTSYDIPLELVVVSRGTVHRLKGIGLPIFQWHFADRGTRVAYGQETVHFACVTHYELKDVQSEQLIASADMARPCGQDPNPPKRPIPAWVQELNAAEAKRAADPQ